MNPHILIVDDDFGESEALQAEFKSRVDPEGRCELAFCSGQESGRNSLPLILRRVEERWPPSGSTPGENWALVLLDVGFFQQHSAREDADWGFEVLAELRRRWSDLPIVMLTTEDVARKSRANWAEADGFLAKPTSRTPSESSSATAFWSRLHAFGLFPDLRKESVRLGGGSLAWLKVLQEARRFAMDPLGAGRLLYGETGTGKTELARFVHDEMKGLAGRAGEFVSWSAIGGSDELIVKDELFGHWQGAHSQAAAPHAGKIERAEGGTFFLDEVSSLPPSAQALFMECRRRRDGDLRRLVSRLGEVPSAGDSRRKAAEASVQRPARLEADGRIAVDVVMLTASNVNLHDDDVCRRIGFRLDLRNDLGAPLFIPGLNSRREDVAELFALIVGRLAGALGRTPKAIDRGVFSDLESRDWSQSNIVGLRRVAEHAFSMARDFDEILVRHLPPPLALPRWAGCGVAAPAARAAASESTPAAGTTASSAVSEVAAILDAFVAPRDRASLRGVLPALQEAYARLVLRLFGSALRATGDVRGNTSSLAALCELLGDQGLRDEPKSYAAYDRVLRLVTLCDLKFEGLPVDECKLLSDDLEVLERVKQAIAQRRRPRSRA